MTSNLSSGAACGEMESTPRQSGQLRRDGMRRRFEDVSKRRRERQSGGHEGVTHVRGQEVDDGDARSEQRCLWKRVISRREAEGGGV